MNFRKLLLLPLLAAALIVTTASGYTPGVSAQQKERSAHSEKTNPVSLCVPDARERHVKETREVSEVQDEISEEAPSQDLGRGMTLQAIEPGGRPTLHVSKGTEPLTSDAETVLDDSTAAHCGPLPCGVNSSGVVPDYRCATWHSVIRHGLHDGLLRRQTRTCAGLLRHWAACVREESRNPQISSSFDRDPASTSEFSLAVVAGAGAGEHCHDLSRRRLPPTQCLPMPRRRQRRPNSSQARLPSRRLLLQLRNPSSQRSHVSASPARRIAAPARQASRDGRVSNQLFHLRRGRSHLQFVDYRQSMICKSDHSTGSGCISRPRGPPA